MTIICALHDPTTKTTWLGSNNGATIGNMAVPGIDKKWMRCGSWALGLTGDGRAFNVLEGEVKNILKKELNPYNITQNIYNLFKDMGFEDPDKNNIPGFGQDMILASATGVYDIDSALGFTPIRPGFFWARGSGMEYAFGAAYVLKNLKANHKQVVAGAVEAAIANDIQCPGKTCINKLS